MKFLQFCEYFRNHIHTVTSDPILCLYQLSTRVFKYEDTAHLIQLPCNVRVNKIFWKLAVFKLCALCIIYWISFYRLLRRRWSRRECRSRVRQLFSSKGSKIWKVSQWGFDILLHAWTLSISIWYRTPQNIDILLCTDRIRLSKSFIRIEEFAVREIKLRNRYRM